MGPLDRADHWKCAFWSWVSCATVLIRRVADKGTRTIFVYSGIFTFLVDAYPTYAASALAANSFTRSTFGAIFPLFGIQSKSWPEWLLAAK